MGILSQGHHTSDKLGKCGGSLLLTLLDVRTSNTMVWHCVTANKDSSGPSPVP